MSPITQKTPPTYTSDLPPTPPATGESKSTTLRSVISTLSAAQAGRLQASPGRSSGDSSKVLALSFQDYSILEASLREKRLLGFVSDKVRFDYDADLERLSIRMPTHTHELLVERIEDSIRSQLKSIALGQDRRAVFAGKITAARSSQILLPSDRTSSSIAPRYSKYEPDASFKHTEAMYPGVILEVAFAQKGKSLERLAENYLLDSDGSVQVVIGLDVQRSKAGSLEGFLSVWRIRIVKVDESCEMRLDTTNANIPLHGWYDQATGAPGLRLSLRDFTCAELADEELDADTTDIDISGEDFCRFLQEAETSLQPPPLRKSKLAPNVRKRKKSPTPLENIDTSDEETYLLREERSAKRAQVDDPDYVDDGL
ncbi:Hypothetical protein D9617_45g091260 [Elsinoe fawcettii]|nr:Hypothetical protein D9617_45g091260 [Elsinoe fawcettii]